MSGKGFRSRFIDYTGQRFGRLLVIREAAKKGTETAFLCRCDCGTVKDVRGKNLRQGTESCGCLNMGAIRHGDYKTYLYRTWNGIKERTGNPNHIHYRNYGGRGIKFFEAWRIDYVAFRDYILGSIGHRPNGTTIDRINDNGHYEPGNLKWSTDMEQGANQRTNKRIQFEGENKTISQWARDFGVTLAAVRAQIGRKPFPEIVDFYRNQKAALKKKRLYQAGGLEMNLTDWARRWGVTDPAIRTLMQRGKTFQQAFDHYEKSHSPAALLAHGE